MNAPPLKPQLADVWPRLVGAAVKRPLLVGALQGAKYGRQRQMLVWLACLILALFTLSRYWQAIGVRPNDVDEGVYTYVGWSWHDGYWPYRDSWARHGPMVFVTKLIFTSIVGPAPEMIGIQQITIGSVTAILAGSLAYLFWGGSLSALAFMLGILLWAQMGPNSGMLATPGSLIGMFTAAGILAAFLSTRSTIWRHSAIFAALTGLSGGLAICTKPNALVGSILGIAAIWWLSQYPRKRDRLLLVVLSLIGMISPIIVFVGLFYYAGALNAFIECYVILNSIYSRVTIEGWGLFELVQRMRYTLAQVGLFRLTIAVLLLTAASAFARICVRSMNKVALVGRELIIPFWLLLELVFLVSNLSWPYHVFPIVPPLALGGTWLVATVWRITLLPRPAWSRVARTAALSVSLLMLVVPSFSVAALQPPVGAQRQRSDWNQTVGTVVQATTSGDKVLVLTWDGPVILNLIHSRAISRYETIEPMIVQGYASDARWDEYLGNLRANLPAVILVNRFDSGPSDDLTTLVDHTLTRFARNNFPAGDLTEYAHRRAFEEFIGSHYVLEYCIDVDEMCLLRRLETSDHSYDSLVGPAALQAEGAIEEPTTILRGPRQIVSRGELAVSSNG